MGIWRKIESKLPGHSRRRIKRRLRTYVGPLPAKKKRRRKGGRG